MSKLPRANEGQSTQTVQPKIILKHHMEFRQDQFKLAVTMMKKNVSWKKYQPKIEEFEHTHIFRTQTAKGDKMKYSVAVGGHFHEVIASTDAEGNIVATCGPALREKVRVSKTGKVQRVIEPVAYQDEDKGTTIVDDHTHDVIYIGTEYLSADKLRTIRQENQSAIGQMKPTQRALPPAETETYQFTEVPRE